MKYTITLLDTASGYDQKQKTTEEVITVGDGEFAEAVAERRADELGQERGVHYLVVGISRGDG